MYIAKNLEWMREYVESVHTLIPNIVKLKRISGKKPKKTLTENQLVHGIITKNYDGKNYRITLYTHYVQMIMKGDKVELSILKYSRIDMLKYLAHELSHMKHWDHTPDHSKLEAKITIKFMDRLKKNGYISEEAEKK